MTVRLIFVSHAPTALTRLAAFPTDAPIEPIHSREHLDHLAGALAGPEIRCVQTGRSFGLDPVVEPALRDCDYGRWAGHTLDEINLTDPGGVGAWLSDPGSAPHGGDSLTAVLERVAAWLDETDFPAGRTAVFTHPAVIRAALVHALSTPADSFWRIDIAPLCRVVLSGGAKRWTLSSIIPSGGRWSH